MGCNEARIGRAVTTAIGPSRLEQVRAAQWFSCVGIPDTKVAKVLSSWEQAIESCNSYVWEDLGAVHEGFGNL